MKQVLVCNSGALVARVPLPAVAAGSILVKTSYSLISTGTEIAAISPDQIRKFGPSTASENLDIARRFIGLSLRDPKQVSWQVREFAARRVKKFLPGNKVQVAFTDNQTTSHAKLEFDAAGNGKVEKEDGRLKIITDTSAFGYQALSQDIAIPKGHAPVLELKGKVLGGPISIGILAGRNGGWIGAVNLSEGEIDERLIFDPEEAGLACVVIANADAGIQLTLELDNISLSMAPPPEDGLPHSETDQIGWNVGYSLSGEVVSVGEGVRDFKPGDRVACAGAGAANHAEYVTVKQNLVARVPEGCDMKSAAMTTVGTIALQGVRRAQIGLGDVVCIIGLGLIGQITCQLVKAAGGIVVGMDLDKKRAKMAIDNGAETAVSSASEMQLVARNATGGHGSDCTIITAATKSDAVINLAMEITRRKGCVIISGDVGLNVERTHFYRKEIDLLMSTSYGPGRYDPGYENDGVDYPYAYVRWTENRNMLAFMKLIACTRIDMTSLIEKEVVLDDAPAAYAELASLEKQKPLAVIIAYPQEDIAADRETHVIKIRGHGKSRDRLINYALVGAGAFGTSMLVPQMQKLKKRYHLCAVVSRDAVRGGNFARQNRVKNLAADLDEFLASGKCDMVVIATRHDQHTNQSIAALKAGKHVFVEKPVALNWGDLTRLQNTYYSLEEAPIFMVGFNRRFSPAVIELSRRLRDRKTPLIINYRLNGGYIPPDHWIQGPEGGGRNLGEACHMYDVFRSLSGRRVCSINATAIDPGDSAYLASDNFTASLRYEDGSIGNLVYTAMGPKKGLSKEFIEVFCDGQCYIIDDYLSLKKVGEDEILWHSDTPDKGHFTQINLLGDAIFEGGDAPIPFDQIMETSAVALHIEDILKGRA